MKKALASILALVFCLSLIAGCGGSSGSDTTSGATSGTASGDTSSGTAAPGDSKEVYAFSVAHSSAEDTSVNLACIAMCDYLESTGRFTTSIYPAGQLGADREAIEGVQNGDIQMCATSPAPQANFVPAIQIYDVPFACPDLDSARALNTNEDFLTILRQAYSDKGFYLGAITDMTFRILTTRNLEVHTPADLKNFNVRTMENANHMLIWSSIGANPTPIAFTELYTALQQGTVDGQENALELAVTQKFYEQQHFAIMTNHLIHAIAWPVNLDWYNGLDAEAKEIFDNGMQKAIDEQKSVVDENQQYYRDYCNDNDCQVIDLTADELLAFRDITQPCYTNIQDKLNTDGYGELYTTFMDII
ncbi:MAG: TRAP transporter substrate-binding protein [Oscillospiraceae bacterium]